MLSEIKYKLFKLANSIGIEKIGITQDSQNPELTVVAALFPYFVANESGNIAMYARARDYHKVNAEKLEILCGFLRLNGANECKIYVDNAARNDREAAYSAGLGFFGRNNLLINDRFGSYFTIGQIVTDLEIQPDSPDVRICKNCGKCEKSCPTNALCGKKYDKSLCISEISQKKGELTALEAELLKLGGSIWGCDICQQACPHNANLTTTADSELFKNRITTLTSSDVEHLNDVEFLGKYKDYAFSWRGVDVFKRNLVIIY